MKTLADLQLLMEAEREGDPECGTADRAWELLLEWEEYAESCAAGPWRYDVENAPKDGSEILAYWHAPGNPEVKFTTMLKWGDGYWRGHGHHVIYNWLIAFAIPNPPQVKP